MEMKSIRYIDVETKCINLDSERKGKVIPFWILQTVEGRRKSVNGIIHREWTW